MTKCIIPCAGFGTRMNMKPNESKELLLDSSGKPIIEYSLNKCKEQNWNPLIIIRAEKTDLIQYCNDRSIETLIIKPEGEWSNTVYNSKDHWENHNFLILPDTRWEAPGSILSNMEQDLKLGASISLGLHLVDNPEKWCIINDEKLVEKPKNLPSKKYWAFGLIGFTKYIGYSLFRNLEQYKFHCLRDVSFQYMTSFKDLTRTGKIEE